MGPVSSNLHHFHNNDANSSPNDADFPNNAPVRTFDYPTTLQRWFTPQIANLLGALRECKGKQSLFLRAAPDVLDTMLQQAKVQSMASSNRIEGISTTDARIRALAKETVAPKNRAEEEIAGYRDVLAVIHESHDAIPLAPNVILHLHRDLFSHLGPDAGGRWKSSDNVIAEVDAAGRRFVRFRPLPAFETPAAVEALCHAANEALSDRTFDPLYILCLFVLDFVSIHPFDDGNGRMSRLLTLLLFYRAGYAAGRYVSLEKLVEDSKESYYETLRASSEGWREGRNDPTPFVRYLLGIFLKACSVFEERVSDVLREKATKAERVRLLFERTPAPLRKRQILEACPGVSAITVERALKSLLAAGYIRKLGAGPATAYAKN